MLTVIHETANEHRKPSTVSGFSNKFFVTGRTDWKKRIGNLCIKRIGKLIRPTCSKMVLHLILLEINSYLFFECPHHYCWKRHHHDHIFNALCGQNLFTILCFPDAPTSHDGYLSPSAFLPYTIRPMTVQIEFTNLLHHTSTVEFQTLETVITLTTVIISAKKYADGYPNLTYVLSIMPDKNKHTSNSL